MRDILLRKVRPVGIDVHGDASAVGWVYARHGVCFHCRLSLDGSEGLGFVKAGSR